MDVRKLFEMVRHIDVCIIMFLLAGRRHVVSRVVISRLSIIFKKKMKKITPYNLQLVHFFLILIDECNFIF